jgi:peroxiredoxin
MSLEDELAKRRAAVGERLPEADLKVIAETIEDLRIRQAAEQSLRAGETLPDFALPDPDGRVVTSDELLDRGPLVLAFFRGGWCPYCDVALRGLEQARPALEELGAALVGVSPLRGEELRRVAEEKGLRFTLLSDPDAGFARLCGVRYEIGDAHVGFYERHGIDLPALHAGAGWQLPIPATYVVGPDGVIRYAFADPDWTRRAEPDELVAVVRDRLQAAPAAG